VLEQAVRQAEPRGLIRTFVDRGAKLRRMLERLLQLHPDDRYVAELLSAFHAAREPNAETGAAVLHSDFSGQQRAGGDNRMLTNRELEVLLLLRQRFSNKEIASKLFIASETVRKHAASIYRKLGVHGRRQAVQAAVRQRLIS
jgi:ATP/maltotriose-dependent transcriptional regulator MalT